MANSRNKDPESNKEVTHLDAFEEARMEDRKDSNTNGQQKQSDSDSSEFYAYVLYISASAIVGSCARTYLSRLFGGDCEDGSVSDFLTSFSSTICVTAGGRTLQAGGALFRDLPANLLGSFIMGLITPKDKKKISRIPWQKKDHPLQKDDVYYAGLGTGLCGSLTTFASWNTQMVVMLDGSYCELGVQILPALFGYLFGIVGALASFRFGRDIACWLHAWKNPEANTEEEEGNNAEQTYDWRHYWSKTMVYLVVFVLLVLFLVGFLAHDIPFYRRIFLMALIAPSGALLRWRLSKLNSVQPESCCQRIKWLPWGTFTANILGAIVSIVCTGILDRDENSTLHPWVDALLFALKVGFAGSLSTVSTFVKEIVALSEKFPGQVKPHLYGFITTMSGMFVGLCLYMAIVRPSL